MECIFCYTRKNDLIKLYIYKTLVLVIINIHYFPNRNNIISIIFTVFECASLKSPLSIARITSHLEISIAR